jgi:hypothetical protein
MISSTFLSLGSFAKCNKTVVLLNCEGIKLPLLWFRLPIPLQILDQGLHLSLKTGVSSTIGQ